MCTNKIRKKVEEGDTNIPDGRGRMSRDSEVRDNKICVGHSTVFKVVVV